MEIRTRVKNHKNITEILYFVSHIKMSTKRILIQNLVGEDVVETELVNIKEQRFFNLEKTSMVWYGTIS